MVQAVEEVNKRHELGNLTLGYYIQDSCSDVTTALKNSQNFMSRSERDPPPVVAVVGDYYSEISIAVTRQLHLKYIPQISYGATFGLLSDKVRFPSFMRTVPEDDHQARAIVEILHHHNWNWVGVLTTDSTNGHYIVERLQKHAANKNICFAFISYFPDHLSHDPLQESIRAAVKTITENPNVTVIVSFARPHHMMYLFEHLQGRGREKVWLASDIWSESVNVLKNPKLNEIGNVLGTTLKSGNSTRMKQYLKELDANPDHHKNNTFLYDFLKEQENTNENAKNRSSPQGEVSDELDDIARLAQNGNLSNPAIEVLMSSIYPYAVFSIELAVRAIVQAVSDLCINRDCKTSQRLEPVEVRQALRKATFYLDGKNYTFDDKGDLNLGYDVVLWRQTSPNFVDVHYIVAHYDIKTHGLKFNSQETLNDVNNVTAAVVSRCSSTCRPGYRKQSAQGQPVCCYECHKCPPDYFSNTSDSTECLECNATTHYAYKGSDRCFRKKTVFLYWSDIYHHVLQAFTALGALLTIIVWIIFLVRWKTPVVRASVGPICIILLFSLLTTFVSVILFGGKPNTKQCQAQQVLFGFSFTLCVSCILVKSFKIILAFEFDPTVKRTLEKLYKPYIIIAVCMAGQLVICALWLSLKSPKTRWVLLNKKDERLLICYENSSPAFGAMLVYIGVLALICFAVAFKGRNLPQCYNDAKFITFAMLIYFICWIIFGPVYVSVKGRYLPAVEMVVILISAYGILFCQFFVKCYIILFKQEENTVAAFRQNVRNFSLNEVNESRSSSSGGVQNLGVDVESAVSTSGEKTDKIKPINVLSVSNTLHSNGGSRQLRRYLSMPS